MKGERLALTHRDALTKCFSPLDLSLSEYSFANLYLFRASHEYELFSDGELFIRGRTYDGVSFVMPTAPPMTAPGTPLARLLDAHMLLFPIPEIWASHFDTTTFELSSNEADSDYLYECAKMATYPGRHLSKKRNLVQQFLQQPEIAVRPFSEGRKLDAIRVLEQWRTERPEGVEVADFQPCLEAIQLFELLQLSGEIIYVKDEAVAFLIGEMLNRETYLVHFAKADIRYKGVYQYVYQACATSLQGKARFLNLEQDLGSPELHQAKHSYQPSTVLKKLRVRRR